MELSEKLTKLRKEKGLTQEELAQMVYVTRTAVSKWENGKGYPATDSLILLSKVYGVSIDYLLSDDDVVAVRRVRERRARIFYWCAVAGLAVAALFAAVAAATNIAWFIIGSAAGVAAYVVFAFLTRPSLSGLTRADFIEYVVCRVRVLLIVVGVLLTTFVNAF